MSYRMSYEKTGGPAFPVDHARIHGMTLRDYFAAAALTGILAAPDSEKRDSYATEAAWRYADAMLKAREQE